MEELVSFLLETSIRIDVMIWYTFHQVNTQWKPNIYGFSPKFSFIVVCFFFCNIFLKSAAFFDST